LAVAEVEKMRDRHTISTDDAARLIAPYQKRIDRARARADALQAVESDIPVRRRLLAVRHLLSFERDTAAEDLRDDVIAPATHHRVARDVATRLVRLESGAYEDPADLLAPAREQDDDAAAPDDDSPAG
ncbi:MAG: hypothetical protein ABI877_01100, partial [Gemmatimonadaceae bacterium]